MRDEADRRLDLDAVQVDAAAREPSVLLDDLARPPRAGEARRRLWRAREERQPRGVASEPVQGPGFRVPGTNDRQQRVLQKAPGGHRGQAARLCHREDIIVQVNHVEVERHGRFDPGRTMPREDLAVPQQGACFRAAAIDLHVAAADAESPLVARRVPPGRREVVDELPPVSRRPHLLSVRAPAVQLAVRRRALGTWMRHWCVFPVDPVVR